MIVIVSKLGFFSCDAEKNSAQLVSCVKASVYFKVLFCSRLMSWIILDV